MLLFQKKFRGLYISIGLVIIFAILMLFGLRHNPNFTPSQLIGKSAPSFVAQLSNGSEFYFPSVSLNKTWIVINFWSSSCYVCREEAHELQNFYETVSLANGNNPQFLSVNIQDDSQSIAQWQKDYSQTFPVIKDVSGSISLNYGVTGTPETFFIDTNQVVRYRIAGAVTKEKILKFISWLSENPQASENDSSKFLLDLL